VRHIPSFAPHFISMEQDTIKKQKEIRGKIYDFLSSKGFDIITNRPELKKLLVEYLNTTNHQTRTPLNTRTNYNRQQHYRFSQPITRVWRAEDDIK